MGAGRRVVRARGDSLTRRWLCAAMAPERRGCSATLMELLAGEPLSHSGLGVSPDGFHLWPGKASLALLPQGPCSLCRRLLHSQGIARLKG